MNNLLERVLARILARETTLVTPGEALALADLPMDNNLDLLAVACTARAAFADRQVHTCAIVNAKSGRCPENCAFCAQSLHHHTDAPVYPLLGTDEILRAAEEAERHGVRRFGIVISGTSPSDRDLDSLCETIARLVRSSSMGICGSLGLLTREKARRLREAGLTSYHHNLETARSFFPEICTTHAYDRDIETLRIAADAGFRVCSCGIFGLGESRAQRVELLSTLQELPVSALPVNFLNPIPGTRLGDRSPLEPAEALRAVALARLMHPEKEIIVCGGRLFTLGADSSWVLAAGASGFMTGNYLTTRGCGLEDDEALLRFLGMRA